MGKQIQIVGANNAPYVAKELDLESGNQFTFAKPDGTDVVEVGALDFIKAVEEYDTFKDWVVNYKRDENTIIPLRIDKIEGNVDTEKIVYTFTNDDVDVSSITLVKLIVEMVNATNEISASYVDETKEIEAGTVLPTPSADDNGKVLGVEDGAYALVAGSGGGTQLYRHNITLDFGGPAAKVAVISTSNEQFTIDDFKGVKSGNIENRKLILAILLCGTGRYVGSFTGGAFPSNWVYFKTVDLGMGNTEFTVYVNNGTTEKEITDISYDQTNPIVAL